VSAHWSNKCGARTDTLRAVHATLTWFQAAVLGIVQGLTEFLPISSTAHLRIVPAFANWPDPGAAVSAMIQLGTMTAVVVFFWRDLIRIVHAWIKVVVLRSHQNELRSDARLGWFIIVGTLPIGILGLLFKDQIETSARDLRLIGSTLVFLGLLMWIGDKACAQRKGMSDLRWSTALTFGCAQALALIPGVSRSGATITAGRALSFSREAAARYSFLLSIPAVVLSGGLEAASNAGSGQVPWPQTIIATVLAFVVGYLAIAWLLKWLVTHSTAVFATYRVALGLTVLVLVNRGVIAPK